jgi:hypothetical protein
MNEKPPIVLASQVLYMNRGLAVQILFGAMIAAAMPVQRNPQMTTP